MKGTPVKPAHLAPKSKSNFKNTIAITAIAALLASGLVVLSMPASATTATALADGERLNFVPSAEDFSNGTNGVDQTNGDIGVLAISGTNYRYKNVHPTFANVDALVSVVGLADILGGQMDWLDSYSSSSAVSNAFIRARAASANSNSYGTARIKVEFFVSGTNNRVTFPSLGVNAYDIDDRQYIEFEGHSSYQLFPQSIIQRQPITDGVERFVASNTETSTTTFGVSTAYTIGRVKANYTNAHTVVFTLGAWGGSAFLLDFGPGASWGANNQVPQQTSAGSDPAPSSGESTSGGASLPVKIVTDISPTQISPNREVITLTGQNLDTATEVLIGGVKARIVSQANGTMTVKPPKGLKGFVDVELKGTLNPVSRIKALEYLTGKAAAAVRKAEIVVGGFDHNSRVLTSRIKTRIERLIDKYPELLTVTCTGFTSLPRRANDVRLSTNRGVEACRFAKAYKPSLVVEVEQGIEDPRPGSNVRRVRVALSQ